MARRKGHGWGKGDFGVSSPSSPHVLPCSLDGSMGSVRDTYFNGARQKKSEKRFCALLSIPLSEFVVEQIRKSLSHFPDTFMHAVPGGEPFQV